MNRGVRIGAPIVIAVIGAILYFAVSDSVEGVDLTMIGLILMIAGGVWLIIELLVGMSRTSVRSERTTVQDPGVAGAAPRTEREVRRDDI